MSEQTKVPDLGSRAKDEATGIDGRLIAFTTWHDRSDECAILRDGVDCDGKPWEIFWFPVSRARPA